MRPVLWCFEAVESAIFGQYRRWYYRLDADFGGDVVVVSILVLDGRIVSKCASRCFKMNCFFFVFFKMPYLLDMWHGNCGNNLNVECRSIKQHTKKVLLANSISHSLIYLQIFHQNEHIMTSRISYIRHKHEWIHIEGNNLVSVL